jgi:hypothetical protein
LQGLPERKELLAQNFRHGRRSPRRSDEHAAAVHGHEDTPELREQIKQMLKDERD